MKDRGLRKRFVGEVVSDKMDKTRIVKITRIINHALYGKVIRRSRKFAVNDSKNESHVGDRVSIIETRPLSKTKRWKLLKIINKSKAL